MDFKRIKYSKGIKIKNNKIMCENDRKIFR